VHLPSCSISFLLQQLDVIGPRTSIRFFFSLSSPPPSDSSVADSSSSLELLPWFPGPLLETTPGPETAPRIPWGSLRVPLPRIPYYYWRKVLVFFIFASLGFAGRAFAGAPGTFSPFLSLYSSSPQYPPFACKDEDSPSRSLSLLVTFFFHPFVLWLFLRSISSPAFFSVFADLFALKVSAGLFLPPQVLPFSMSEFSPPSRRVPPPLASFLFRSLPVPSFPILAASIFSFLAPTASSLGFSQVLSSEYSFFPAHFPPPLKLRNFLPSRTFHLLGFLL